MAFSGPPPLPRWLLETCPKPPPDASDHGTSHESGSVEPVEEAQGRNSISFREILLDETGD